MLVVVRQIVMNGGFQRGHALEGATANAPSRDGREETFHLIEPARARGREVQMVARVTHKPADHLRRFVGTVVIHDDVHVSTWRQLRVEALEEFQKLLMSMTAMTLADHFPGGDIQGREQRRRAMADVVMGLAS